MSQPDVIYFWKGCRMARWRRAGGTGPAAGVLSALVPLPQPPWASAACPAPLREPPRLRPHRYSLVSVQASCGETCAPVDVCAEERCAPRVSHPGRRLQRVGAAGRGVCAPGMKGPAPAGRPAGGARPPEVSNAWLQHSPGSVCALGTRPSGCSLWPGSACCAVIPLSGRCGGQGCGCMCRGLFP